MWNYSFVRSYRLQHHQQSHKPLWRSCFQWCHWKLVYKLLQCQHPHQLCRRVAQIQSPHLHLQYDVMWGIINSQMYIWIITLRGLATCSYNIPSLTVLVKLKVCRPEWNPFFACLAMSTVWPSCPLRASTCGVSNFRAHVLGEPWKLGMIFKNSTDSLVQSGLVWHLYQSTRL